MVEMKPKRPLSSFNLFYRYKRSLLAGQGNIQEETIKSILTCPAGLEDELLQSSSSLSSSSYSRKNIIQSSSQTETTNNELLRSTNIRTALKGKILPSDTTKRRHRKAVDGPSISFVEMGRMMTESWKNVDPFAKQVFDDLAGEGRAFYKDALEEYNRWNDSNLGEKEDLINEEEEEGGGEYYVSSNKSKKTSLKKSIQKNKKKAITVHKVSRCVKKAVSANSTSNDSALPIMKSMHDSMLFDRGSMEPHSVDFGTNSRSDGLMMDDDDEGSLRRKTRTHTCPNPEDIVRLLSNAGLGPLSPTTSSGLQQQQAYVDNMQSFSPPPPPPPQFGNSQLPPPPPSFGINQWSELNSLNPFSISSTNNNVASSMTMDYRSQMGVNNEGKRLITTTTNTAPIYYQSQGNEWNQPSTATASSSRPRSPLHGSTSLNLNVFLGASLKFSNMMNVSIQNNNRVGSPMGCDNDNINNSNKSLPPLTPVSQSSGSDGRSLISDIPSLSTSDRSSAQMCHHHQRQMYHGQDMMYNQQHYHRPQQLQQQHQHHQNAQNRVNATTIDLTSQDPFDDFHPIHNEGYDVHLPSHPMQNSFQNTSVAAAVATGEDVDMTRHLDDDNRVDFLDDYCDNPVELNLNNAEDVRTFFDPID